jgi:hypothetical protein
MSSNLPQFIYKQVASNSTSTTISKTLNDLHTNLNQIFTSLLSKVQLNSILLTNVQLVAGSNQFPHTLGKKLTGWSIVRQRASSSIYDAQDTQSNPQTYLTLVSSANVTVDILVF